MAVVYTKKIQPSDRSGLADINTALQTVAGNPATPLPGQYWYDSVAGTFKYTGDGVTVIDSRSRAFATGLQTASTISDLAPTVKAYTLDTFAPPVALLNINGQRITSVGNATVDSDAPNFGQLKTALDAALNGVSSKSPVAVVSTSNITLTGTQTIDGVALSVGQRVLVAGQTNSTQNGPYTVATGAWPRAQINNDDTQFELDLGATWLVLTGTTYASSKFRITAPTSGTITPGTTNVAITQVDQATTYVGSNAIAVTGTTISAIVAALGGIVVGANGLALDTTIAARKFLQTITGDGSTAQFTLTHGFGNLSTGGTIQDTNRNQIDASGAVQAKDANNAYINFAVAPANGVLYYVQLVG